MYKTFQIVYIITTLILLTSSCKKENEKPIDWDYGPFNYGNISSIQANGSIVIELVQGTENKMVRKTKGGPQIVGAGGGLILNGSGTVTIAVKDPLSVSMNGGGGLKSSGYVHLKALYISNQMGAIVLDSMQVDSTVSVTLNNLGDCSMAGTAGYLIVSTTNLPAFYGFGLIVDSCYVSSSSLGQVQVNVTQKMKGVSYSSGDVFYKGNPATVDVYPYGGGHFFPY